MPVQSPPCPTTDKGGQDGNFANLRGHCNHGPSVQNIGFNAVQAGLLTKPVSIGLRSVGWPDYEVEAVTAARVAGQPDEAIRALVHKLHAQRAERFEALTQTVAHA